MARSSSSPESPSTVVCSFFLSFSLEIKTHFSLRYNLSFLGVFLSKCFENVPLLDLLKVVVIRGSELKYELELSFPHGVVHCWRVQESLV